MNINNNKAIENAIEIKMKDTKSCNNKEALIQSLKEDGYSIKDIESSIDNQNLDFLEKTVMYVKNKGHSNLYIYAGNPLSRKQMLEEMINVGFSVDDINYALDNSNIKWAHNAALAARVDNYYDYDYAYSDSQLYDKQYKYLEEAGFTQSEISESMRFSAGGGYSDELLQEEAQLWADIYLKNYHMSKEHITNQLLNYFEYDEQTVLYVLEELEDRNEVYFLKQVKNRYLYYTEYSNYTHPEILNQLKLDGFTKDKIEHIKEADFKTRKKKIKTQYETEKNVYIRREIDSIDNINGENIDLENYIGILNRCIIKNDISRPDRVRYGTKHDSIYAEIVCKIDGKNLNVGVVYYIIDEKTNDKEFRTYLYTYEDVVLDSKVVSDIFDDILTYTFTDMAHNTFYNLNDYITTNFELYMEIVASTDNVLFVFRDSEMNDMNMYYGDKAMYRKAVEIYESGGEYRPEDYEEESY